MLKTAYVDAVATLPAVQGQGYGSALLRHLAQNIDDYEIACLQTDIPAFYQRLRPASLEARAYAGRSDSRVYAAPTIARPPNDVGDSTSLTTQRAVPLIREAIRKSGRTHPVRRFIRAKENCYS